VKQRIRRFEPWQVAKIMGIIYAIVGLIFAPFVLLTSAWAPEGGGGLGTGFAILLPILYGVVGFITTAIGAALYNLIAGWIGGIELDIEPVPTA
jgi:hypothetical protein